MARLQAEIETQNELRRSLSWIDLTGIGLGSIIGNQYCMTFEIDISIDYFLGAGIFVLSGQAANKYAGPSVILSFILTGFVALLSALSYSEMSSLMASSGAVYTYTYAGKCYQLNF
jgi:amino acid transporter